MLYETIEIMCQIDDTSINDLSMGDEGEKILCGRLAGRVAICRYLLARDTLANAKLHKIIEFDIIKPIKNNHQM